MKRMIASDIHGSAYYCALMLEAFHREGADRLLLLGDLLYHGPRNDLPRDYDPRRVIDMLNAHRDRIVCVRGNCEAEVDQMVLTFPVLSDSCILCEGEHVIFATHGHLYHEGKLPPLCDGDVLLHGHTHVPACRTHDEDGALRYTYLNPGSISIPKEGSAHSYMIQQGDTFLWKDLLDPDAILQRWRMA